MVWSGMVWSRIVWSRMVWPMLHTSKLNKDTPLMRAEMQNLVDAIAKSARLLRRRL